MAVAKRQGREKSTKIQKGRSKDLRQKKTALLASPIYIGQAQGDAKKHKKRSQSTHCLSLSLSPPHAGALPHSLLIASLSWHALSLEDGFSCYFLNKIEL